MTWFLLPKSLCGELENIFAKFWWQKGQGKKGIHWCQQKFMCHPKEEGGIAKQGWRIINNQNSLVTQVFKAKYFSNDQFLNSRLGNSSSYIWKSIWVAKGILVKGLCWQIGTSINISINDDAWILDVVNFRLSSVANSLRDFNVNEFIDGNERIWKRELINNTFSEEDSGKILRIPLTQATHDDFLVWGGESSGEFSWLTWVFDQFTPYQSRLFCCALWAIWGGRNIRIHEKRISIGKEIVNFINNYIAELNGIENRKLVSTKETRSWSHPPREFIKINFDSAYDGNYNHSTSGIVVRNEEGIVLLSCSEIHQGVVSAFAAEAIAC
ncbi:reverse transcriptase [Gossypium australe]|uniref:Reverse transcriptase n=1 Tax=Gossypium australe TaxID=47621 RepID=A0A5B6WH03_9ROSI|nr:reverse transcriptase [Gossypium australe]